MADADFPAGGRLGDYVAFWAVWLVLVVAAIVFVRRFRGRKGAMRLVVGNLLVLASLAWTAIVVGETYLRWIYDATDSYGLTLTNWSWFGRHVENDSEGFREREFEWTKPAGRTRVVFLGDSYTMGWGVKRVEDTYPARVGAALDARSPNRFDVLDLAVPGYATGEESVLLDQVLARGAADRVIVGYCLNDVDDLLPDDRKFVCTDVHRPAWIRSNRSFLADFLWYRFALRDDPRVANYFSWVGEAYDDPKLFARQAQRFRHMADACRAARVRLDVVVFPFFHDWGEHYAQDAWHARVADAWRSVGVEVVDLRDAYRGIAGADLVVGRFDAHPNERAHEIAAREVLARLFDVR